MMRKNTMGSMGTFFLLLLSLTSVAIAAPYLMWIDTPSAPVPSPPPPPLSPPLPSPSRPFPPLLLEVAERGCFFHVSEIMISPSPPRRRPLPLLLLLFLI